MALDLESLKAQILSMKNLVKQVKTHLINKMTREAKKLREKKGTEEQKKKNVKKADRFIEEVMIMKALRPEEVSRFVLKTESCESVVSKMNIPLQTKVLAKFGTHKILSPAIEKFRTEHPTWKEEIDVLLEKLPIEPKQTVPDHNKSLNCSIVRTPGNNVFSVTPVKQTTNAKSENTPLKSGNKQGKKNIAKIEEVGKANKKSGSLMNASEKNLNEKTPIKTNGSGGTTTFKNESVSSSKGNSKLNPNKRKSFVDDSSLDSETDEQSDEENLSKKFKIQKNDNWNSEDSDEESDDEDNDDDESDGEASDEKMLFSKEGKKQKHDESKTPDLNSKSAQKTNQPVGTPLNDKSGKQTKLNKELDEIEQRLNKKKATKKEPKAEEAIEESVDPFFVTTQGEEYISSAPVPKFEDKPPSSFSHNSSPSKEFYRKGKKITPSFQGHQNKFNDQNNKNNFGNYQNRNNSYDKNDKRNSFNNYDRRNSFNNNDRRNSFNNNDRRNSFKNNDKRNSFNNNDRRNNKFNKNDSKFNSRNEDSSSGEHIHPSWEAKKKMSTLAPFQGIKTVFNE